MAVNTIRPLWPSRLDQIDSEVDDLVFPNGEAGKLAQDEEWCEVLVKGKRQRIRFHDYHQIYRVPGLYEKLFYEELKCCSPSRIASMVEDLLLDFGQEPRSLRVLDVGAGNGMVGDELAARNAEKIVGIDIIPEAKDAARRDRPDVYDDYLVADLTDLPELDETRLRAMRFNCLTTVAALGFGDIPPAAFLKGLDLIETPGWTAFNIKENFLHEDDDTGFCRLVRRLTRERIIQVQAYRRYRHRLSVAGRPLYYVAMVARKLKDVSDDLLEPSPA